MSHSPPTFGKRGAPAARPPAAPPPSAAHLELAAAAREALRGADPSEGAAERSAARPGPREDDDMRAFIGPRWGAYRGLWAKMKDAPRLTSRRSFVAGSFSSVWLLYRKQYRLGAAILAAQAAMMHTEAVWTTLFDLAVAFYFGKYGMSIVLGCGARTIARVRAAEASPEIAAIRVGAAGGVNWVAALSGAALLMGLALADMWAPSGGANDVGSPPAMLDSR